MEDIKMYCLVRITSNDYREYRKAYSKIQYSFFKKGEEDYNIINTVTEGIQSCIKTKSEFLKHVEAKKNELYFFYVEDEIQGIAELIFDGEMCNILEFAVFKHGQGLGTALYEEILKIIKMHKSKKIILYCPFEGAQVFWYKKGFSIDKKWIYKKKVKY